MDKKKLAFSINEDFLHSIANILKEARSNAKTAINLSMVYEVPVRKLFYNIPYPLFLLVIDISL